MNNFFVCQDIPNKTHKNSNRTSISYSYHRNDRFEINICKVRRLTQGTARVSKIWRAKVSLRCIFKEKSEFESIQHLLIATGVPRGNGQVERINRIVITILSKLGTVNPQLWYKNVKRVQQFINASPSRSAKFKDTNRIEHKTTV